MSLALKPAQLQLSWVQKLAHWISRCLDTPMCMLVSCGRSSNTSLEEGSACLGQSLVWERSWGKQELGTGTFPFQPMRGFPDVRSLPARKDLRKFLAESPRLPAPPGSSGGGNVLQAAPECALLGSRYFFHWVHTTRWTPQMGRSCLTFRAAGRMEKGT